jgi:hypothetical protein
MNILAVAGLLFFGQLKFCIFDLGSSGNYSLRSLLAWI